jgi:tRNA dimethylallyltransferase
VEEQIAAGLVDEVRGLLAVGVPPDAPAMSSLGYPEIVAYLQGILPLAEAIAQIKFHTHRYARHQLTWLRRMPQVHWFDPREPDWYPRLLALARGFLGEVKRDETDPSGRT